MKRIHFLDIADSVSQSRKKRLINMFDICARTERTLTLMVGCEGHFSGKVFQRGNGFRVESKKWDNKKRINVH